MDTNVFIYEGNNVVPNVVSRRKVQKKKKKKTSEGQQRYSSMQRGAGK